MNDLSALSLADLMAGAQGCTEFSCLYHGAINMEIRRRQKEAGR